MADEYRQYRTIFDPATATRPGAIRAHWREGRTLLCDWGGPLLAVTPLTAGVVRFRLACDGRFAPRRPWAPAAPDDAFPPPPFTVEEGPAGLDLLTDRLIVRIGREGGRVAVLDRASGRPVLEDGPAGGPAWDAAGAAAWTKRMPPDEHYFGFGERVGLLDKRGLRYTCWTVDQLGDHGPGTDLMYAAIPFLMGLSAAGAAYGLFLNNTWRSAFDLTAVHRDELRLEVAAGDLDWYLFYGPEPATVVEAYTALTGRIPLPPRWALGYHQSRYSYVPEARVREIARELRERRIPADAIHLDIDYMDSFRVFTWDREKFPDPPGLIRDLAAQGFKVVTIVDPGVKYQPEGGYQVYDEGHARDCFLRRPDTGEEFTGYVWPGRSVFPDFVRPDVRAWWGDLHRDLVAAGVRGIWNDMNEPALNDRPFGAPGSRKIFPPDDTLQGDPAGPAGPATHAEVHNLYGQLEDRGTYEGLRRLRPAERPFVLTRSGFAGVGRYAALWTGDNRAYWEHLELSLPQLLNLGLSGLPFVGADIGGFGGNGDPELFARWMQLGAFYPFARGHSAAGTADKEPWAWGPEIEEICRRALALRYRLLPYFYTLFEEAGRTGAPILRPLFFHHADDPATHLLHDQALVGRDLLIAPVYRPGKSRREVYLPRGRWYNFRLGEPADGPAHVLAVADLDTMPLYARGGAVVPLGPALQYTDERPLDRLTLHVYPDEEGAAAGALYEDDGLSFDYERGVRCLTRYACRRVGDRAVVTAAREGGYTPAPRAVEIRLFGAGDPQVVELPDDPEAWEVEL